MKRTCFWGLLVLAALVVASCAPVGPSTTNSDGSTNEENSSGDESMASTRLQQMPGNLKARIDAALDNVHQRDLRLDNSFWTIFHGILGTGPGATLLDPKTMKRVNALDYMAEGGQVRGLEFLITPDGLDVRTDPARLMFEGQGHQDQFIAEMAQWDMPADRRFTIQGREFTFRDFVNHTKMRARVTKDQELSWAIVIIAQYLGTDLEWTNRAEEKLRFEDVVRYEMNQPIESAACGGTHRLFGMTWAYHLYRQNGGKKTGVWKELVEHLDRYKRAAKEYQNPIDSSFSTRYVSGPGNDRDS